jgi:hypothetical protein
MLTLGAVPGLSQPLSDGEIAGRITERQIGEARLGVLPGARITVASGNERREAVTDGEGRFAIRSLKLGTYSVTADLAGFVPVSGSITLSPETRRAHLEWSLEIGCLSVADPVLLSVREAVRIADAVAHFRVDAESDPVQWSVRPSCGSGMNREYIAHSVHTVWRQASLDRGSRELQILKPAGEARLSPGEEYLAYLVWQPRLSRYSILGDELVFPVRAGRVTSPKAGDLNGLAVTEAMEIVRRWFAEPRP